MSTHNDFAFTRESLYGTIVEPTYAGATSFMRGKYSRNLEGVDVAVSGIPYDLETSNRSGARLGQRAIRAISSTLSWGKVMGWGFDPFDDLAVPWWTMEIAYLIQAAPTRSRMKYTRMREPFWSRIRPC